MRDRTLADIFSNSVVILLLLTSITGFYALRFRNELMDALDKRFYRNNISPAQILSEVISEIPQAKNIREQCIQTLSKIDKALHPSKITLFLLNTGSDRYTNFENPALYLNPKSALVRRISSTRQVLSISDLQDAELEVQGNYEVAVQHLEIMIPMLMLSGHMIGFFLLGPKRSDIEYSGAEKAQLLQLESKTSAAVRHQNLAAIYDIQWYHKTPVLIFELLQKGTLSERLSSTEMEVAEVVDLGISIATALEYLHKNGVWHQDIKPGNIAFDSEGTPKLLDFGMASIGVAEIPAESDLAKIEEIEFTAETLKSTFSNKGLVGTPLYWSPEILAGKVKTESIDVWALILVLYESLALKNPVGKDSWPETFHCIAGGNIEPIEELVPKCPAELAKIIHEGLTLDINERITNAADLIQRLQLVKIGI